MLIMKRGKKRQITEGRELPNQKKKKKKKNQNARRKWKITNTWEY